MKKCAKKHKITIKSTDLFLQDIKCLNTDDSEHKMLQIINITAVNVMFDSSHERIKCIENWFLYRNFQC